ncbi:MAG TPA: helical backbone metal receptor [Capsulimonadaceae bacterium]
MSLRKALACLAVVAATLVNASAAQVVVDDLGRKITLPHGAQRIIAIDPSSVEVLFAIGAGSRIVATTPFSNYPPEVAKIRKIDALTPSREVIAALRPDLIMVADQTLTAQRADAKSRIYGAPLFVTNASTYEAVESDIRRIGGYFGDPKRTAATVREMARTLADVRKRVANRPRRTVFDIVWVKPLMTAGKDSFIGNLIATAGGIDIACDAPKYAEYPVEKLIAANPDFILVASESLPAARESLGRLGLKALKTGRLCPIPDDYTVRPGPRLALGLVHLAKLLHPEAFAGK